jgi:hypothetical protein
MKNLIITIALLVGLATCARAQFALNEVYSSHAGTDDMEFVEIVGSPGASMQGLFLCVVDGDDATAGTLDLAIDLSAGVVPADGYFVLGTGFSLEPNADLVVPNALENGSQTYYLIQVQNSVGLNSLVGLSVGDLLTSTTNLSSFGTILDLVAVVDAGALDLVFDGAEAIGPDGNFGPAGIFRNGDFPNDWNDSFFLDFDDVANMNQPRTPGAANTDIPDLPPAFPGNGGDVAIEVLIDGAVDLASDGIHSVDTSGTPEFSLRISSPDGSLQDRGFALVATFFLTGSSPISNALAPSTSNLIGVDAWVDLATTVVVLDGNPPAATALSPRLSPGGFHYGTILATPLLAQGSVMFQAFADAPGFGLYQFASSDARELQFTM